MPKTQKQIDSEDLVNMDMLAESCPFTVDLVYAKSTHPENIFKTALYHEEACLYLHKELADIVIKASEISYSCWQGVLVLKDGLRPIEAQQAMQHTEIVRANPQWLEEGPTRLLSPPGLGGHPRGMAIDLTIKDEDGCEWDMGTSFDHLTTDPSDNPAARDYKNLSAEAIENRKRLETAMMEAADFYKRELLPLSSEWWDFRFPAKYSEQFLPISDKDLPQDIQICASSHNDVGSETLD